MRTGRPSSTISMRRPAFAFAFWSWIMLAVATLSSLPLQGQTAPRQHGSAFDPTTSSMAIRPKRIEVGATIEKVSNREPREWFPDRGPFIADIPLPIVTDFVEWGGTLTFFQGFGGVLRPRLLTYPIGARAPPSM